MCWNSWWPKWAASSKRSGERTFAITARWPGRIKVSNRIESSSRAHARRMPSADSDRPYHRRGPIQLPWTPCTRARRSRSAGRYVCKMVTPCSSDEKAPGLITLSALGVTRYPSSVRSTRLSSESRWRARDNCSGWIPSRRRRPWNATRDAGSWERNSSTSLSCSRRSGRSDSMRGSPPSGTIDRRPERRRRINLRQPESKGGKAGAPGGRRPLSCRQCAFPDDGTTVDCDRRAREAPAEVEVRLVLPAGDLVVRSDRDVYVSGDDGVLQEPRSRLRIQSDVEVSKEVLRPLRLFPLGPDEILVLRSGELHHPASIEGDPDVADPSAEPGDGPVEDDRAVPGLFVRDDKRLAGGDVGHVLSRVEIFLRDDSILDPGGSPDEVAREPRSVGMGDFEPSLLR